jgi:hypothetical protein
MPPIDENVMNRAVLAESIETKVTPPWMNAARSRPWFDNRRNRQMPRREGPDAAKARAEMTGRALRRQAAPSSPTGFHHPTRAAQAPELAARARRLGRARGMGSG